MGETATCGYCRDTYEDPEHHLTVDVKVALDAQQIGPGGCPACRPHLASASAMEFYSSLDEAERRLLSGGGQPGCPLCAQAYERLRSKRLEPVDA